MVTVVDDVAAMNGAGERADADFVSVVCPVYNEERFIAGCIEGMLRQDYPRDSIEFIFIDGGSLDSTMEILEEYSRKCPNIRIARNSKRIIPVSMNIGINLARGETVVRIDAHALYPDDYVSRLVSVKRSLEADNVGGVCVTVPAGESSVAHGIAIALSTPFGMGDSRFRTGASRVMEVDTVPFGCFSRSMLLAMGGYDERFVRNQDDELNGRIRLEGGKIWLVPDVRITYYPRNTFSSLWKMWYGYGLYKPMVARKLGKPATVRQMVPPLFVLVLCAGLICGLWKLLGVIGALWLAGAVGSAVGRSHRVSVIASAVVAYSVVHLSYGYGYLGGLIGLPFSGRWKKSSVKVGLK